MRPAGLSSLLSEGPCLCWRRRMHFRGHHIDVFLGLPLMLPLYNLPIFFVVGPDFRHSFLLLEPQFMSIQLSKLWALGSNCRLISRCNLMQVFVFKTANYSSIILSSESSDSIIVFTTWSKRAIVTNYNTFPSFFKCFLKPEGCDFE